jgi:hypothetical protein
MVTGGELYSFVSSVKNMRYVGVDIGIRNFSLCVIKQGPNLPHTFEIERWMVLDLAEYCGMPIKDCRKVSVDQLHTMAELAFPVLFPEDWLRTEVAQFGIESQPGGKYANPHMVLLSHLLLSYVRGVMYANPTRTQTLHTAKLVAAVRKYNKPWLASFGIEAKKRDYRARKALSKQLCTHMLDTVCKGELPDATKQDDYADSLLIGLSLTDFTGVSH